MRRSKKSSKLKRWRRETPTNEIAMTLVGIGAVLLLLLLAVVAAILILG